MTENNKCAICGFALVPESKPWKENYCTSCAYFVGWKYPNKINFIETEEVICSSRKKG
jgi:hypothetical protein